MTTVGISVARAREVAGQLEQQLRLVDGLREGHTTVLNLALDWGVLGPIRTAMSEFTEDTGNAATLLRTLADYAEAADNGATGGELAHFEALAIAAMQRVHGGLDDGTGSGATDAEVNAYLDAYFSSDEYLRYQLQYGEFDLGESFEGGVLFSDGSTWRDGLIEGEYPPEVEFNGGGAILGPDGRVYPIIIPTLTDANGDRFTHRIGDLNGYDVGWEPIGYRVGFEQFSNELSFWGKTFVTGAGATGLDIGERIPDDHLAGLQFRFGEPPRLGSVPVGADTSGYVSAGSGRVGSAVDYAVAGVTAFQTFNSLNSNVDRAYEVVFEEHETGARRATVTTHTLEVNGGRPYITAWDVHVTEDDKLGQIPGVYQTPEVPRFDVPAIESGHPGPIREDHMNRQFPILVGQNPIDVAVGLPLND